jgi:ABC-2 type transport system permease protein
MASWLGALRYEFLMQIRRPSLWIGFLLTTPILFAFRSATLGDTGRFRVVQQGHYVYINLHVVDALAIWATASMFILLVVAGLVLADRLPRDRYVRVEEILATTPPGFGQRIAGKYVGAALATLIPLFVIYAIGVGLIFARYHDFSAVTLGLLIFLSVHVPAVFFVAAFAIACTTFLWGPLFQFLFVGYWLWNALNPAESIPTLSGTLISPGGNWVLHGFFGVNHLISGEYAQGATPALALANLAVLAVLAAVAIIAGVAIEQRRVQNH